MNTFDFDSKDYFILKLKDGYDYIRDSWKGDVFLSFYDCNYCLSRIHGAFIFNEFTFNIFKKESKYYLPEYFVKIPLILLNNKKEEADEL